MGLPHPHHTAHGMVECEYEALPGRHLSRLPDGGVPGPDPGREDEKRKAPRALLRTGVEQAAREAGHQSRNIVSALKRDLLARAVSSGIDHSIRAYAWRVRKSTSGSFSAISSNRVRASRNRPRV